MNRISLKKQRHIPSFLMFSLAWWVGLALLLMGPRSLFASGSLEKDRRAARPVLLQPQNPIIPRVAKQSSTTQPSSLVPNTQNAPADKGGFWNFRINRPGSNFTISAAAEQGFLAVLSHTIRFGKQGTNFDYIRDGGQNVLFPFLRLSAEVTLFQRHTLIFLYQPIDLKTQTVLRERLVQDMATFQQGESLELRYGFDFYRVSYLYDLLAAPEHELSIGLSLQIRNATIVFSSTDGTKRSFRNDIGPVPVIKARGRFALPHNFWLGFEADGFYAPVSYINGSDSEVVGAILDASLRAGKQLAPFLDIFVNLRYVGGGAVGAESRPGEPGSDGHVENWIHLLSLSLGVAFR